MARRTEELLLIKAFQEFQVFNHQSQQWNDFEQIFTMSKMVVAKGFCVSLTVLLL